MWQVHKPTKVHPKSSTAIKVLHEFPLGCHDRVNEDMYHCQGDIGKRRLDHKNVQQNAFKFIKSNCLH